MMLVGLDRGEYGHPQIQPFSIEDGDAFDDISLSFEPLDALPAGTGRQAHFAGDVAKRTRCVGLQRAQYLSVDQVEQTLPPRPKFVKYFAEFYTKGGIFGRTFSRHG